MNKEEIIVSAEVKTYLIDLYSQIEYELQEQYNDEVQKLQQENEELQQRINKTIEYIESNSYFKDNVVKTMIFKNYSEKLIKILKGE